MPSLAVNATGEPGGEGSSQLIQTALIQFVVQDQDPVEVHVPARRGIVYNLGDAHVATHTMASFVGCPPRSPHQTRPPALLPGPQLSQTIIVAVRLGESEQYHRPALRRPTTQSARQLGCLHPTSGVATGWAQPLAPTRFGHLQDLGGRPDPAFPNLEATPSLFPVVREPRPEFAQLFSPSRGENAVAVITAGQHGVKLRKGRRAHW